ncbi:MAG TPA: hypothetical protein VMZ90_00825 [Vicinamibacterales bacterium]|nr:hypothetical protein [Vicinamibacterales bacterium]
MRQCRTGGSGHTAGEGRPRRCPGFAVGPNAQQTRAPQAQLVVEYTGEKQLTRGGLSNRAPWPLWPPPSLAAVAQGNPTRAETGYDAAAAQASVESPLLLKERLRRAVATLPGDDATLVLLRHVEGLSLDELAVDTIRLCDDGGLRRVRQSRPCNCHDLSARWSSP